MGIFFFLYFFVLSGCSNSVTDSNDLNTFASAPPELISPTNGSAGMNTDVVLSWKKVEGSNLYNIHISSQKNFTAKLLDTLTEETTINLNNLPGGRSFFWRVRSSSNSDFQNSKWSEIFTFTTKPEEVGKDTTPPELSISINPTSAVEDETILFSATATDASGISAISHFIDGTEVKKCTNSNECNFSSSSFNSGTHVHHAVAIDNSPNLNSVQSADRTFSVTTSNQPTGDALTIMPLGDSITEAFGYRVKLWDKLVNQDGYNIDWVGSQSDPTPAMPDHDHEGHGGWNIGNIAENVNDWLNVHKPDYILLMIGTNDVAWWSARTGEEIAQAHAQLVDQILRNAPDAHLFVSTIPPMTSELIGPNNWDRAQLTKDFNAAMAEKMQQRMQNGERLTFVDINSSLTLADLLPNGNVHPNDQGYEKIAQKWYEALKTK